MRIAAPQSERELIDSANYLKGKTLKQIAAELSMPLPSDTLHAKGWVGELLEVALGADASTAPRPDFVKLGIELKTIPVDHKLKPKESTFVCVVQLERSALSDWESSLVKTKLSRVLWIPYEASAEIPIPARRLGNPILWSPDQQQLMQLRSDWQEFSDMIVMGDIQHITASMGEVLQIRPKAANARSLTQDTNQTREDAATLPRGFYLRPSFTQQLLAST